MELSASEVLELIEEETRELELVRARAEALAEQRTKAVAEKLPAIGLATTTWEHADALHPMLPGLLEGVKSRLRASGCDLLLFTTIDSDPDAYLRRCRDSGVAGVILHGFTTDDSRVSRLLEAGIPCVGVDDIGLAPRLGHVSSDNVGGALSAVRHLAANGYRRIATIHAPLSHAVGGERLLGYRIGLEEVGLPVRQEYLVEADFFIHDGVAAMEELLRAEELPDAVFAASDGIAIGAMSAIEKAGLRVPDDIAIVGFDDGPHATMITPALTTIRQDAPALGLAAAEGVLRMIADRSANPIKLIVPTELIVRQSSVRSAMGSGTVSNERSGTDAAP